MAWCGMVWTGDSNGIGVDGTRWRRNAQAPPFNDDKPHSPYQVLSENGRDGLGSGCTPHHTHAFTHTRTPHHHTHHTLHMPLPHLAPSHMPHLPTPHHTHTHYPRPYHRFAHTPHTPLPHTHTPTGIRYTHIHTRIYTHLPPATCLFRATSPHTTATLPLCHSPFSTSSPTPPLSTLHFCTLHWHCHAAMHFHPTPYYPFLPLPCLPVWPERWSRQSSLCVFVVLCAL